MAIKPLSWERLKAYPFEIKVELMMIQPQGRGSGEVSSFGGERSASENVCMRVFSQMRHREEQKKHFSLMTFQTVPAFPPICLIKT